MLGIRQISPATAVHASCVLQLSGTPHHPERQFALLAAIGKSIVVYEVIQDNALDKEERPSQRRASDNGLPSVSLRARNHTINIGGTVSSMAELCRQCFAVWTVDRELIVIRYQGNLPGRTVFDKPWIVLYRDFMRVKPVFCYKAGVLRSIAKGEVLGLLCKRPIGFTRVRLVFPDVGDVNTLDDAWRWPSVVRHTHQDEVFGGVFSEPHRSDVSLRESVRKSTKEELWSSFSPVDVADEDLLETHSIRELCAHKHKVANHLRKWHAERHPSLPQVVVESIFQDALTVYTNGYPDPDFWRLFVCAMDEEDGSVKSLHSVSLKDEVLTHAVLDTKPPYGTLRENKMIFSYDESIIFDSVVLMDSDGKPAELWMVFHNGAVKMVPMSDTAPAAIHSQSSSEDPEDSDDDGVGSLVPRADILGLPDHFAPRRILSLESYGCGCGYTTRFALLADDIQDVYIVDLVLRRVETKLLSDGAMTSVCLGPEASLIAAHSRGVIRRLDPCLDSPITLQRRLGDPHLIRSLLSIDASHGGFRFMASTRTAYRMFEVEWGHTQTTRHSLREVHANLPEATMSQLTSLSWSIVQSNTGEPVVAECSPTCISIGTSKIQFGFTASHASITSANVEGVVRVMAAVVEEMTVHVTTDLHTSGDLSSLNSVRLECNGGGPVSAISVVTDSLATTKAYVAVAYWDASTEVFELHLQPSGWTSYSTFQAKTDNVVHHMEHLQHSSSFKSGKPVWLLSLVDHRIAVLHSGAAGCASWSQRGLCNTEGIALNASLVSACRTFMSEIPQMGANFHAVLCHGRMFSLLSLEDDPSLVKAVVRCSTGYDARDSSPRWIDATMVEVVNDRIPSFAVVLSDGMDVVVTRPPPMFRLTDTVGAGGRSAPSLVLSIQTPTRYEATTHVSLPNVIDGPRDVLCLCVYAPATQRLVCVARRAERSVILSIDANTFAVEDSLHLPHYATATCAAGIPPRAESSFLSDIGGNDAIVVGTACVDRPGSIHIILPNPLREVTSVTPSSEEEDVHDISLQRLTHSSRPDDVLIGVACGKSIYVYRLVGVSLHVVCSTKCPGVCSSIALCYPTISVAMGAHGILYLEVVPRVTATSTRKRLDANVSPKVPQREEPDHDDSNVFIHGCTLRVCASEPMLMSNVLFQDSFGAKFVRCDEFGNLSLTHMLSPQSVSHDSTSAAVPVVGVRHGHQSKMTHSLQLPSQPTMSCMLGPLTNAAVSRRNPRSMMWSDKFCVLQSTNNNCGLFIPCQDGSLFAAMELPYSFAHPLLAMEQIVTDLWWHTTFSEGAHVNCQDSLRDGNSFTYRSFMTVQHAVSFESEYATAHPTHAMTKQGFVWLDAVREFYSVQRAVQRLLSGRASMKTSAKDGAGTVAFSPTTEDERIHSEEHFMAALMREKWTSLLPILRQALGEEYGPEFSLEYCEEVVHFW